MGRRELDQVIKVIERVRNPGDSPAQSSTSFELLECDLCKGDVEKSKLTQCPYCGRWICKGNCWNKKNLACISCSSVIELSQREGNKSNFGNEDKTKKDDNKGFIKKIQKKILK